MPIKTLKMQNFNMLSIIIVNYRSEQYLEKCLASIYRESNPEKLEIIIVNNDQQVDLRAVKQIYPAIRLIAQEKNIGFGRACNVGAKEARGELLLFLNPDTQFLDDYASRITDIFKTDAQIGIVGSRLMTDEGKTQWWITGKEVSLWQILKNNLGIIENKKIWESKTPIFTDWVSGAALTIRCELFKKIGGFDENFFMYFEDEDLCWSARKRDFKVLYDPTLSILHSGGKSCESKIKQKTQFLKSLLYRIRKKAKNS